jgi:xanthine dehydrogenase YagS FAD-binding subunit
MAMIRDVMPDFELYQPTTISDAVALLRRHGRDGWAMAGGLDSVNWFKDRVMRPKAVVDLSGITELKGVRVSGDGVEIGALTTLRDVSNDPEIKGKYTLLATSASKVASVQIRNQGTLGGNVAQDTWCHYYRGGLPCYRAGGSTCYADTPTAMNREHCLFGADRCVAVNPSDTAPALIALDAKMVIRNSSGERVVDAQNFFINPGIDITRMTVLQPGDLLTAIRIPNSWANATYYFEKVAERDSWDFALVSVASAMMVQNGVVQRARVAVNGVAPYPMRLQEVEGSIIGERIDEETASLAGETAVWGARPLNYNHYKVPLLRNLVKRAVRGVVV